MADTIRILVVVDGRPAVAELKQVGGSVENLRGQVSQLDAQFERLESGVIVTREVANSLRGAGQAAGQAAPALGNTARQATQAGAALALTSASAGSMTSKVLGAQSAITAGLNPALAAAIVVAGLAGTALVGAFRRAQEAAAEARQAFAEAVDEVIAYELETDSLTIKSEQQAEAFKAGVDELVRLKEEAKNAAGIELFILQNAMEVSTSRTAELEKEIVDLQEELDRLEPLTNAAAAALDDFALRREAFELGQSLLGLETDDQIREREQAEREAEREAERRRREAERRRREAENAARSAARRRAADERREREQREREIEESEREIAQLRRNLTLESLADQRDIEAAGLEETLRVRQELIAEARSRGVLGEQDALALQAEAYAIYLSKLAQLNREFTVTALADEVAYRDAVQILQERQAVLEGAKDEQILQGRRDRLQEELDLLEAHGIDAGDLYDQLILRLQSADLDLLEFRADLFEGEIDLVQAKNKKIEAEERASYDRRLRDAEQFAQDLAERAFDVLLEAASSRREITDAEIALTRRRFDDEAQRLRESAADNRDYHLELQLLAEQRAAFEKEVEEDRASFLAKSLAGLAALAKDVAVEVIRTKLAEAAANYIAGVIERLAKLLGPVAIPIAIGGAVAILGLSSLLTSGFAQGGEVRGPGSGTSDDILALLSNGEHVITARAATGQHTALQQLNRMMERGLQLDRLLLALNPPAFARGGPVLSQRPVPVQASGTLVDAQGTRQLVRDVVQEVVSQIAEIPVVVRPDDARGIGHVGQRRSVSMSSRRRFR